jgi:hypothetical protein
MTFYDLGDDTAVNLDHVTMVICKKDDGVILFADGSRLKCTQNDAQGMAKLAKQVIPAAPGFELVTFHPYDAEPTAELVLSECWRQPILAWRVEELGMIDPVTLTNTDPSSSDTLAAIIQPNGTVVGFWWDDGGEWKDIGEWAKHVCAKWVKRRTTKAADKQTAA